MNLQEAERIKAEFAKRITPALAALGEEFNMAWCVVCKPYGVPCPPSVLGATSIREHAEILLEEAHNEFKNGTIRRANEDLL